MSPNPEMSAPGSSTYSSNTLHVGDGTWDSGRDTFLLPNLMGLNFETMQYNGMGNRFRDMPNYRTMICAHGVLATIAFLGLVPASVLIIRYYSRWNPYWAFKLHVWCQVLTLFMSTIVFVLGWFAVGPERSLSNPHHGIGLAIYVLVIFQVMWGYLVHRIERNKKRYHVPFKLVIHRWIGRILAILGIVQIPLGLTLYGSPKVFFILFAIAVFTLFVAFFVLSYLYDTEGYPMTSEYDSRASYVSGPSASEEHHHGGNIGRMAALGAAGAGLAQLFRRRSQHQDRPHDYDDSHTSYMDEKYSDEESRRGGGGWGKKLLELGAIGGAGFLAKKLFDRRRNRDDDDTESGTYSRAHTRSDSMTEETMSRMEDGRRPEPTHRTPLYRPPSRPPSRPQSPGSSYYNSTYLTDHDQDRPNTGRNALFGAGALGALKNLFGGRKNNDQRRLEEMRQQEMEEDRLARANSNRRRYTDPRHGRDGSYTATDVTSDVTRPPHEESLISGRPPRRNTYDGQHSDLPPAPPSHHHDMPSEITGYDSEPGAAPIPIPGRRRRRRRSNSNSNSKYRDDHSSPPVSVELKIPSDGRHVTLRRLTEEEAAANRESRRKERRTSRRRNQSASSLSGNEGGSNNTWRRVEEIERQQQEEMERQQAAARAAAENTHSIAPSTSIPPSSYAPHPSRMSGMAPPPPPPLHQSHPPSTLPYGSGSYASPGPGTFTGTEASGDYANNRRRRRAERARRQNSVDFT